MEEEWNIPREKFFNNYKTKKKQEETNNDQKE